MVDEVYTLLVEKDLQPTASGNDYLIRCLSSEHPDYHPSLRIDKIRGIGHCLSCGFRVNIFKYYGKEPSLLGIKIAELKEKISSCRSYTNGIATPSNMITFTRDYRNIRAETYREFGALESHNKEVLEGRLVFPIKGHHGNTVAFNGRAMDNFTKPKYKIYPRNVTLPFYPHSIKPKNNKIVLVEGIFDFLNLYDKGFTNVLATLGTQTLYSARGLNKEKETYLKAAGVTHVVLMFDSDEAGITAANELERVFKNANFIVTVIRLKEGDPGDLTQEQVDYYNKEING